MLFSTVISTTAALLGLAGQAEAVRSFVIGEGGSLVVSRMDPIVDPGKVGGHVHRVIGGSAFTTTLNNHDQQVASKCTSLRIDADKSNYWTPSAYWINKNGTFSLMPHATKVYYFMIEDGVKYHAFPPGFRMITGNAMMREPGGIRTQGIEMNMRPYQNDPTQYNHRYLPNGTTYPHAPDSYIQMNIRFPSCGLANQSLDSDDHFSHMTWPVQGVRSDWAPAAGGTCPESHPIRYPQIFMENWIFLSDEQRQEWNTRGPNFVLSNGDTTGLTYHADFVNGWDIDVLQQALDTCPSFQDGADIAKCAAFKDNTGLGLVSPCRSESMIPAEDVGVLGPLDQLPGCNPLWDWDGPDAKPTDCPWYKGDPSYVKANLRWADGADEYRRFNFPIAIPGLDDAAALNRTDIPGGRTEQEGARLLPWGPYKEPTRQGDMMDEEATWVQIGTQEAINDSVNNPVNFAGAASFDAREPPAQNKISDPEIKDLLSKAQADSTQTQNCNRDYGGESPLPCVDDGGHSAESIKDQLLALPVSEWPTFGPVVQNIPQISNATLNDTSASAPAGNKNLLTTPIEKPSPSSAPADSANLITDVKDNVAANSTDSNATVSNSLEAVDFNTTQSNITQTNPSAVASGAEKPTASATTSSIMKGKNCHRRKRRSRRTVLGGSSH